MRSKVSSWLQLLRAPNLFTVPGDPVAGFLLGSAGVLSGRMLWPVGAALCFYSAGLLLNDLVDLREDARERPARPLPSGAVDKTSVLLVLFALFVAGLVLCWVAGPTTLAAGGLLLVLVLVYHLTKSRPLIAPFVMGACRAASLLLGAAATGHVDWGAPLLLFAYVAAVTYLARFETLLTPLRDQKWFPSLFFLLGAWHFLAGKGWGLLPTFVFAIGLLAVCAVTFPLKRVSPLAIGRLIAVVLPMQAGFCASSGGHGLAVALLLLALWPISRIVGRRFYAS